MSKTNTVIDLDEDKLKIGMAVCDLMVSEKISAAKACQKIGVHNRTFLDWTLKPNLSAYYAHAREALATAHIDELLDDAQEIRSADSPFDVMRIKESSELKKWVYSRIHKKHLSEKLEIDHSGQIGIAAPLRAAREARKAKE